MEEVFAELFEIACELHFAIASTTRLFCFLRALLDSRLVSESSWRCTSPAPALPGKVAEGLCMRWQFLFVSTAKTLLIRPALQWCPARALAPLSVLE